MRLYLASASPRRREILTAVGIPHTVVVSEADETLPDGIEAMEAVTILAERKARAARERLVSEGADLDGAVILAADTVVECFGAILGKPRDRDDARRMITMLCGCGSAVHTGICIMRGDEAVTHTETTYVTFDEMSAEEIEDYISTDEPYDKAGGYAIQGKAGLYIAGITGDYFNVVGLPVHAFYALLRDRFGILPKEFQI
jgi:septum formation protein